jgi:hypothetical protein
MLRGENSENVPTVLLDAFAADGTYLSSFALSFAFPSLFPFFLDVLP